MDKFAETLGKKSQLHDDSSSNNVSQAPTTIGSKEVDLTKDSMACKLDDIPNEILGEILLQLDLGSLKSARQACSRWAKEGARGLFRRIYFAPNENIMDRFLKITSRPALAISVTELVYDARMFWECFTKRDAHSVMFNQQIFPHIVKGGYYGVFECDDEVYGDSSKTQMYSHESFDRYVRFFDQQKKILDEGKDYHILCQGLSRLPNLKVVTISDVSETEDCGSYREPVHRWYCQWSRGLWRGVLNPSSWEQCVELVEDAWHCSDNQLSLSDYPWDWRGVTNCLNAIALHGPRVNQLHVATQSSTPGPYMLMDMGVSESLDIIAERLQFLKLDCGFERFGGSWGPYRADSQMVPALKRILKKASNLRTFSSSLLIHHPKWVEVFGQTIWPHLSVLELGDLSLGAKTLKALSEHHRRTLSDLRLRNVSLVSERGLETWEDVGNCLGHFLKLRNLSLDGLYEPVEDRIDYTNHLLVGDILFKLGMQLMRWVPTSSLGVEIDNEEQAWVSMWHV